MQNLQKRDSPFKETMPYQHHHRQILKRRFKQC